MAAIVGLIFTGLFGIAGIAILAVSVYSMVYWIRKVKRFPRCEGVVTGFEKWYNVTRKSINWVICQPLMACLISDKKLGINKKPIHAAQRIT